MFNIFKSYFRWEVNQFQELICNCLLVDCFQFYSYNLLTFLLCIIEQIVSPFPPSDKIGINSVQRESEEILDMKQMKMDWVPYIPLGKR